MAYQKTWQYVPNYVPDNSSPGNLCKNIIWYWSRVLKGDQTALTWKDQSNVTIGGGSVSGGWFCWGSTDGGGTNVSTGGTSGSPATDYWTSTFNAAKIVQAAAGSNHSWICLGSPSNFGGSGQGPFYFIIDCSNGTTTNVNIVMCKATPTGGTATARPTSTDEVVLQTVPFAFTVTTTLNYHMQGMLSTDGIFRSFWSRDGLGSFQGALCAEAFNGALSGDPWPAGFLAYTQDTPSTTSWLYGLNGMAWNFNSAVPNNNNGCWRGRNYANTGTGSYTSFVPTFYDSAANAFVGGFGQNTNAAGKMYASNPANGKWDNLPWWGVIGTNDNFIGFRGSLYDVGLANARKNVSPLLIPDGTYDTTNGAMCVGDSWQPACVAPSM